MAFAAPVLPRNRAYRQSRIALAIGTLPDAQTCITNLLSVYDDASDAEIASGTAWYSDRAAQVCADIITAAGTTGRTITPRQAAGILAALSPSTSTARNGETRLSGSISRKCPKVPNRHQTFNHNQGGTNTMEDQRELEHLGAHVTITTSAGSDGAVVVFVDTDFEPDASDGGPGLRVILNDGDVFVGKPYQPSEEEDEPESTCWDDEEGHHHGDAGCEVVDPSESIPFRPYDPTGF